MTTPVYCSCGCVQYVQRLPSTIGLPAVYTGQSRSGKLIREMEQEGWGEMTVRGELPPRRPRFSPYQERVPRCSPLMKR